MAKLTKTYGIRYEDKTPLLGLCADAQCWYEQCEIPTKVKACATVGLDELLSLAGVAALTIVPEDIRALKSTERSEAEIVGMSLFPKQGLSAVKPSHPSYLNDEAKYRMAFDTADEGRAQHKLAQVRVILPSWSARDDNPCGVSDVLLGDHHLL